MTSEDLSSLSCSIKLFLRIIMISLFLFFYSLCCILLGTDLLLDITRFILSALYFASHALKITFFCSPEKLFICMITTAHYCGFSCHMTVCMVAWRKAALFWNTKNSFYTSSKMFAIPHILTQANLTKTQHKILKTRSRIPHSICCNGNRD